MSHGGCDRKHGFSYRYFRIGSGDQDPARHSVCEQVICGFRVRDHCQPATVMLGGNLANVIQVVCVISNSTEYNICKEIEHRVMYHTRVCWRRLNPSFKVSLHDASGGGIGAGLVCPPVKRLKVNYGKNPKLTFEDGRRYPGSQCVR